MATRSYGQFCGLGHALEIVGERWGLLIVRDLMVGPKRFTDLRNGLPRIPTNVLTSRLKQMEESGVIHRRLLPRPSGAVVYELTPYGWQLEEVILALSRWGTRTLGEAGAEDIVTVDSLITALRSMFQPEAAASYDLTYELRWDDIRLHLHVDHGVLTVGTRPLDAPDLIIEAGLATHALMTGEVTPEKAIDSGLVRLSGDPALLSTFVEIFHL
jgi:DNA-binding HxlR family transcriptional regulator